MRSCSSSSITLSYDNRRSCLLLHRPRYEWEFGQLVSLIVFLTLYFLFLWIAWLLAVRATAPNQTEAVNTGMQR